MRSNPHRPIKGRVFRCNVCKKPFPKLGLVRSHYVTAHPGMRSNHKGTLASYKSRQLAKGQGLLPTAPAPTKPKGTAPRPMAHSLRFCPSCGFGLSKVRVLS